MLDETDEDLRQTTRIWTRSPCRQDVDLTIGAWASASARLDRFT